MKTINNTKKSSGQKNDLVENNLLFNPSALLEFVGSNIKHIGFSILICITFITLSSCEKGQAQMQGKGNPHCPPVELIKNPFMQEQKEIKATLDALFQSIKDKDADKLISFHVYGPKFTEFKDSEKRVGSAENEAYERGFVGAISDFAYDLEELQIDVFGAVGVVTFHANFRPVINGNTVQIRGGVTLVFVKVDDKWKITHEHFSPLA